MKRVMNINLTSMNLSLSMQGVMMVEWMMKIAEKIDGLFSSPDLIGGCCWVVLSMAVNGSLFRLWCLHKK